MAAVYDVGALWRKTSPMRRTLPIVQRIAITLLCAIVFRGLARSQELTSQEVQPSLGEQFVQYPIADFLPWDTIQGTGALWDYAWITVDSSDAISYASIALSDAPAAAGYPEADRVIRRANGVNSSYVIDQFFDTDGGLIRELGSVGPVLSYVFDQPETQYAATMQLGDTLHGYNCFGSDGLGVQYHFCGANYTVFDAVGTLILPFGSYADVKHVTHAHASTETSTPGADTSYTVVQQWFVAGTSFPMLEVTLFIASDGAIYPNGRLMDITSLTGIAERAGSHEMRLWPNPATDVITIARRSTDVAEIEVVASDGRVVQRGRFGAGQQQQQISLHDRTPGAYLVRVQGSGAERVIIPATR